MFTSSIFKCSSCSTFSLSSLFSLSLSQIIIEYCLLRFSACLSPSCLIMLFSCSTSSTLPWLNVSSRLRFLILSSFSLTSCWRTSTLSSSSAHFLWNFSVSALAIGKDYTWLTHSFFYRIFTYIFGSLFVALPP